MDGRDTLPVPDESGSPAAPRARKTGTARRIGLCLIILMTACLVVPLTGYKLIEVTGALAGTPGKANSSPAWSPDGSQIAFDSDRAGNSDIYIMQADGSHVTQLTRDPFADLKLIIGIETSTDWGPAWSPDGQHLAFTSGRDNLYWRYADFNLYEMNTDGSHVSALTTSPDVEEFPSWSPDGSKIVYADVYPDKSAGIKVLTVGGTGNTALTLEAGDTQPKWSPDGSQIAFISPGTNHWELSVVDANGGHRRQLPDQGDNSISPTWSPDGRRIAFTVGSNSVSNIYVINVDDSNVAQLTKGNCASFGPAWSPDGNRIAFVSDCNGNSDIYVMHADGSQVVQLTGTAGQ